MRFPNKTRDARKALPGGEGLSASLETCSGDTTGSAPAVAGYFGGAGVNPSRLRPGSGLGLGLGAFLTSFLPLSLLPMGSSVPQKGVAGKDQKANGSDR